MVEVLTQAFSESTVAQRMKNFSGIPSRVTQSVASFELRHCYNLMSMGATRVSCLQASFDQTNQLLGVQMMGATDDDAVGNDARFSPATVAELLTQATAAEADGYLLKGDNAAALYIHEPTHDTILICERD